MKQPQPAPETFTLHFGSEDPDALVRHIRAINPVATVFRDGDSWADWGEGRAASTPEHVQVISVSREELRQMAMLIQKLHPHASCGVQGAPVRPLAVITRSAVWAEQIEQIISPHQVSLNPILDVASKAVLAGAARTDIADDLAGYDVTYPGADGVEKVRDEMATHKQYAAWVAHAVRTLRGQGGA